MSDSSIEALLYEKEGSSLDFKREQYPFDGASDDDKSELLKDILAFANAWRGTDAHILIGFEEVRGGRSRPIGVKRHLDEAKLQQFINSKLQKPLRFAYGVHFIDCVEIGVISIPLQDRPFFLKKDFGRLKKDTVYLRHGSSTGTADPDEVARMVEARLHSAKETTSRIEDRARREWKVVEQQELTSVALSFMHRRDMPVATFMKYVGGISVRITSNSPPGTPEETVTLKFRSVSDATDLQSAFRLAATSGNVTRATSDGVTFYRKATSDEIEPRQPATDFEANGRGPNDETDMKPPIRSTVTRIEAVTMICSGWAYTTSNKDVWVDPAKLSCGVRGSLSWSALWRGSACARVECLGRLRRLEVLLPNDFDLRPSDEFELTWFSSGDCVFLLHLENLRFARDEQSGSWSASVTGPWLYAHLAERFIDERIRRLAGAPDEDAG